MLHFLLIIVEFVILIFTLLMEIGEIPLIHVVLDMNYQESFKPSEEKLPNLRLEIKLELDVSSMHA